MKVLKRDGRIQDFDLDKIKYTLGRVSDEVSKPFTSSDIDNICVTIQKSLINLNKNIIPSSAIHQTVIKSLQDFGFIEIAEYYELYRKKFKK